MKPKTSNREPLKCDQKPDEALRIAMMVPPPDDWKVKPRKPKKRAK